MRGPRNRKNKEAVLKWAKKDGRKVLWQDKDGNWFAARDRSNTPNFAVKTEDVKEED